MGNRRKLEEIAASQHGYFTARQAIDAGYVHQVHSYHVRNKNWLKCERALYRLPSYEDNIESDFVKWSLWVIGYVDDRAPIISHDSALYYYGLTDSAPGLIHLTVKPMRTKREKDGCQFHYDLTNSVECILPEQGFCITTPCRTLQDMRGELVLRQAWGKSVQAAFDRRLINLEEMRLLMPEARGDVMSKQQSQMGERICGMPPPQTDTGHRSEQFAPPPGQVKNLALSCGRARAGVWGNHSGFTLVELLVVMTIIAILASFLLSVMRKGMEASRSALCQSNLKQQGITIGMYLQDNHNGWCAPQFINSSGGTVLWYHIVNEYIGAQTSTLGILRCSSDTTLRANGFQMRNYAFNGRSVPSPMGLDLRKITRVRFPSQVMMAMDGRPNDQCVNENTCAAIFLSANLENIALNTLDTLVCKYLRHPPGFNALHVDGHAKSYSILYLYGEVNNSTSVIHSRFVDMYRQY